MEFKISVRWITAFFDSWRATSAVIKSNPGEFLRGNNLMWWWTSDGEKCLVGR
jgi:hypothetical protein